MDEFAWTIFIKSLQNKTLDPNALMINLKNHTLTPTQEDTVKKLIVSFKNTIYGVHISTAIFKATGMKYG